MSTAVLEKDPVLVGVYRGIVVSADDPISKLRVKLKVPGVFGDDDTDWALPANPLGLAEVPDPGTTVWVQFEGGDPSYPVYFGSWIPGGTPVLREGDSAYIAPDSITAGQIASGAITASEMADFVIGVRKYNDSTHHFDPPAALSNSPTAGSISWPSFVMVYKGVAYTIAAGNTALAYAYWLNGGSTLTTSASLPTLTVDDCLVFLNKGGIVANAQVAQALDGSLLVSGSIFANAIAANSIGTAQLAANSITAAQIAAGAINGQTITGAIINGGVINGGTINGTTIVGVTLATAASGARVFIQQLTTPVASGAVQFYSGHAAELAPSYLSTSVYSPSSLTDAAPVLTLQAGIFNAAGTLTAIQMQGAPVGGALGAIRAYIEAYSAGDIYLVSARQDVANRPVILMKTGTAGPLIQMTADDTSLTAGQILMDVSGVSLEAGSAGRIDVDSSGAIILRGHLTQDTAHFHQNAGLAGGSYAFVTMTYGPTMSSAPVVNANIDNGGQNPTIPAVSISQANTTTCRVYATSWTTAGSQVHIHIVGWAV